METIDIVESATLTLNAEDATGKRWRARIIKSGWGSKGFYTPEALSTDGPTVFKAGTPIFMDHPTPDEREIYQFGKVSNLVGELATDAVWNAEESALDADVEIYDHQVDLVKSVAKRVGLSVRATCRSERGTVEGRTGRIITGLVGAKSVDLVVRAGAGGQLLEVLESESEQEMEEQQMDEVLKAIQALSENVDNRFATVDAKFSEIEESLAAVAEVEAEEKPEVEAAESVDIEKTVAELVAAEVAKLHQTQESAEHEGNEENAELLEESATNTELKLPKFWAVKGDK